MSEVGVYPTFELSTSLNAVAPAPTKHASDSDAPFTQYLSSSPPAETSTIVIGADGDNSKSSNSVAAVATAAVALIPHCHSSAARRAGEHSSLVLSSEAEQSLGDVTSNLHVDEGVAMLPTPFNLMSRRATLPFTAGTTNHGDGGANASEGAFRFALPTLVGRSETLHTQDFTSCAAHTIVTFMAEREPSGAHQQLPVDRRDSSCPANVDKVAAEDVPAAGRGRLSLSDSLISALGAARDDGRARQAMDVACTPCSSTGAAFTPLTTAGMSHAERYFSSLCAKWRPGAIFSFDSEAASSSSLCLCAVGNDTDPSFPSCGCSCLTPRPNRNSVSRLLSTTMPPLAPPSGVPAAASTPAAPAQLMVQCFSSSTPRDALSATTIPTVAAATSSASDDGDEAHLPALFPDTGAGADAALHTDREGRQVDAERVLGLSGYPAAATCILAEIPSTLHAAFTAKRDGEVSDERIPPCPGVSGTAAGTNTERETSVNRTPNHVLVQPNTLLLTDLTREMCSSCAVTGITSRAAQLSSSMQLLGLHERKSVAASLSAPQPLQQHDPCGGDTAASKLECLLELMTDPQEQKRGFLLPFSPRDATTRGGEHRLYSISGDPPAAATDASLTRSPLSPSWPPLSRARRRGSAATSAEMKLLPEEGAEVCRLSRPDMHDEEETLTLTSGQLSRSVWRELDGTTEGCRGLSDTVLAAPATPRSRSAGISMGSSGDAAPASVNPACAFFLPFLQSHLSKWLRWVNHRYHGVVCRISGVTGEERSLPKSGGAFQKRAYNNSSGCRSFFPPEASAEAIDNGNTDFHDVCPSKGDIPHLSLTLSLSGSLINSSLEGEPSRDTWAQEALSSLTTPWNGGGNSSWLSVGLQAEQRGVVCATGELMQLRGSIAAPPLPPSSSSREAPFPTSSGKRPCVSPTLQSLSLSAESLMASQIFSVSAPQWPSRGLVGLLNSSGTCACLSGDYRSSSLHSSLGCRSRMGGSTASTIADDRHRDTLYRLFHQPPSSLMGNVTECYEAYQAMMETFSKGHHSLSWGELGLLLRPEDYLDYRALFPPQHFVNFEDFVEFVEVLSVRYRR
ncbi:hypothetical protein GH5_00433 [Leishmania sp. Ghana 2012 LV757]|uniref:hypothetical protein n=1 Tax=Leishmania sp. Ghana 2012 LV757 TaxID=2803181 RepID=UPI001B6A641D|nr:hypothetical protein GH5_00433 [Leishmania sp. Ghana 2012 LV757]